MMKLKKLSQILLLSIGLTGLVACQSTAMRSHSSQVYSDVFYATSQNPRQALDIYLPPNAQGKVPAVIVVHGGAYVVGSKKDTAKSPLTKLLLDNQMAVVAINYRLLPDNGYPSQTDDVNQAFNFIRTNGERYGIDTQRLAVIGESAGGQLAQYVSNVQGKDKVRATVTYFAPSDVVRPTDYEDQSCKNSANVIGLMSLFLPKLPKDFVVHESLVGEKYNTPAYVAKAKVISPLHLVSSNTPPILMFHGNKDCFVPMAFSQAYQSALQKQGVEAELIIADGLGHGDAKFFNTPSYNQKVIAFLKQKLGL